MKRWCHCTDKFIPLSGRYTYVLCSEEKNIRSAPILMFTITIIKTMLTLKFIEDMAS